MAARKLKVFVGTHQNLFASGEATVTTDDAAIAAALEHPETPLRRAVGSNDAFQLEPASLPTVPDAPKRAAAKAGAKSAPAAPSEPPADSRAFDAAEAKLHKLDEARKRKEADHRRRQDALDAAKSTAQAAYVEGRKAATAVVVAARKAYRSAGGTD